MNTLENFHQIIHVSSLTNQELIVEILVAIKSLGRDSVDWLLTTLTGQQTFLEIASCAAELKLLPSEWSSSFERIHGYEINKKDNGVDQTQNDESKTSNIMVSTSQLLSNTLQHIPDQSYVKRLELAVEMIECNTITGICLSIHEAASLVKASTVVKTCIRLQSRIMSIFLELCAKQSGDEHVINALASVQLPILQRLDTHVFDDLLFHKSSFRLYDRITTLFQYKDKGDGIKENRSIDTKTRSSALKLLGFVEAANLARRGNQIGSKHGCVITVSKDVIKNNLNLLKVIEKSKDLNVNLDGDDNESTSYDIIVGKGWNHNVVPNGKGGKKRMVHAEAHAVADTIQLFEEDLAFNHIFPFATAVIVELKGDTSYDDAPPCPKCELLLRAVGVHKTCHSTDKGYVKDLDLPPSSDRSLFFRNPIVRIPFRTVCDELCIQCSRFE